jgi:hypothetical protein
LTETGTPYIAKRLTMILGQTRRVRVDYASSSLQEVVPCILSYLVWWFIMHIGCCLLGVGAHVIEDARQKTEFVKYHTAWLVSCYAILSSEDIQHMHDPVEGWVYHSCLLAWHFCLGPLLGMVSLANILYLRVAVNRYLSNECQPRRFSLANQKHQHTLLTQAATESSFKSTSIPIHVDLILLS